MVAKRGGGYAIIAALTLLPRNLGVFPSSLWGGVRGGGRAILSQVAPPSFIRTTPLPTPPPQGGREQTECAPLICSKIAHANVTHASHPQANVFAPHVPPAVRLVGGVARAGGGGADVHVPTRRCRRARDKGRAAGGRLRALLRQARRAARSVCSLPHPNPGSPGFGHF